MPKPRIYMDAPVVPIDLLAFDPDTGEPYEISQCHGCYPWRAEVAIEPGHSPDCPSRILVREWHAIDCPEMADYLDAHDAAARGEG